MESIKVEDNGKKGRFVLLHDSKEAGEMTFVWDGENKIVIEHTYVGKEFGGKGYAKKLMKKAVSYARENEVKVVPVCSFVVSMFEKDESIQDVLA
ncbi:MAG TPA: GNAT family N-acetyltransferase [Flavobacteriaceae bacterium]|nr:GNAT family N-acetyltransferase [Flavobacteriaceae bacterium]